LQLTDSIVRTEIHATEERGGLRRRLNCRSPPATTVCCFLPERTAMVQNFMTRDTWTGDVDETVSVHNPSDPSVGDSKRAHAKLCHEAASSVPESCLFSLLHRRSWVPPAGKQAGKTVVVPDEERTTSFFSKDSLQACLLCRLCGP
jgi:hypothetical protein